MTHEICATQRVIRFKNPPVLTFHQNAGLNFQPINMFTGSQ